jgi:hypothetical protein
MSGKHLAACAALVVVTGIAVVAGLDALAVLGAAGCVLMMGAMVWMMVRAGARRG